MVAQGLAVAIFVAMFVLIVMDKFRQTVYYAWLRCTYPDWGVWHLHEKCKCNMGNY